MAHWISVLLLTTSFTFAEVGPLSSYAKGLFAERAAFQAFSEGEKEEAAHHFQSARQYFETTLQADPNSFAVAERTARTQFSPDPDLSLSDLAAASKTLRTYATAHPDHLPSQLHYADFLRSNASKDAVAQKVALATLEAVRERYPHHSAIFSRLFTIHEEAENREASLALFESQFAYEGTNPHHWVSLIPFARALIPGDDSTYRPTLDELHLRARRDGITQPMIARRVSDYYRQQGRLDLAVEVLNDHVAQVPNSLELRTRLGLLLIAAQKEEQGIQVLEETITIDPDQVYAHRSLASYYERRGNEEKTLHHRSEVLRAVGGDPLEFIALANRYLENNQPHPARLLLEKARFDHPEHPAIAARLAIATLRDGDSKAAAHLFRQAETLAKDSHDPEMKQFLDADYQIEFSRSLREAGDSKAAESRLREAIRSVPDDQPLKAAHALRELARLWLDQNKNHRPAIALLKRAESLDPGNSETKALLRRIQN